VSARSNASRAREDAARAELLAAQQRVRARTQQVYQEAQITATALGALRPAADAAAANYAQAEARFNAGFGSSLEFGDAEILRTQAEIDLAVGKFQRERARSALERVTVDGGVK
jgi:outer membrane protein